MATYKVLNNQNIWDISLLLYGSIEGAFDLFISNPSLSMTTELKAGDLLEYHEDFVVEDTIVEAIADNNLLPANSERHIYSKLCDKKLVAVIFEGVSVELAYFIAAGEGTMIIDWGDNSDLEEIALSHALIEREHYFNSTVDSRRIKIYGDFSLTYWDVSKLGGEIKIISPLVVDEFYLKSNSSSLDGLFLFSGTYKIDIQSTYIKSLEPIYDMSLQELSLLRVEYKDIGVLDDYLQYIASHYGNRRPCTVTLDTQPSSFGINAINTIINEPAWNESGNWKFIINDTIYTKK